MKIVNEPEANSPFVNLPILQNLPPREPPPCLRKLIEQGVPEGKRNTGLFNILTFIRKAYPDEWNDEGRRIERALELNQQVCNPPMLINEVYSLVKSVGGARYQYLCSQEPILSLCEKTACEKLEFGVNHKPWKEKFALVELEELNIRHLRRVDTDPPWYIIEVRGVDITMSNEEFYHPKKFMRLVEDHLRICPRIPTATEWDKVRHDLYEDVEDIEAPDDASEKGAVLNSVVDFLMQYRESRQAEDLMKGNPILRDNFVYFKAADLQKFLKMHRRQFIDNNELYTLLYERGGKFQPAKIKGREVKVWMFPIEQLRIISEEEAKPYMPHQFNADGGEKPGS